ncbi:MAG: flagellar filament capping protein FliD, partial [Pseudomonas sp.]|nr:flagellar filament capping protein FliD [Pseudomonas sp.]
QEGIRVLADLGITTQKDGTLKIDDAKLASAITDNFGALGTFFTGDNGLMSRVDKRIDGYIQTGGVLEQRMKGIQTTLTDIDKQKETLARRVSQLQTRLFAQFNAMDALVGNLNATSDRLTQALGSLPGVVKQSN